MGIALLSSLCVMFACAFQPCDLARSSPAESSQPAIKVGLEMWKEEQWQPVDPQTVFHAGEEIRFRFMTTVGGYLYVMNHSSDGEVSWLFPLFEKGQRSRVEPGPQYLIPGTRGSFVVGGKPGFDVTNWVLSPVPIDTRESASPTPGSQPSTLEPRCRTETLRARGLCLDDRAGPRALTRQDRPPLKALQNTPLVSRDLKFQRKNESTHISLPSSRSGVIVYEFVIAHN